MDGCSTDKTRALAEECGAAIIENPKQHAAGARRLGIDTARCPVVAFTDSDCVPAPDWLERIAGWFEADPLLDGLGGRVVLSYPTTRVQAYSANVFESIKSFPTQPLQVRTKGVSGLSFAGANCAFARQRVIAVGNFRDEFSNAAEEVDLLWRMVDADARLFIDPTLTVEHLGYTETVRGLVRASFRQGRTSTLLTKHHGRSPRIDWALYRKWLKGVGGVLNPWNRDPWSALTVLQIGTFIAAKWYTSLRVRTINL